jgi:hypothetical protein
LKLKKYIQESKLDAVINKLLEGRNLSWFYSSKILNYKRKRSWLISKLGALLSFILVFLIIKKL